MKICAVEAEELSWLTLRADGFSFSVSGPGQSKGTTPAMRRQSLRGGMPLPDWTPNPKHEQPREALETWSEALWSQVPDLVRSDVEGHLRDKLPPELLAKWRDQHARGVRIGSDDPFFHLGSGMAIRNCCREQLLDEELPVVTTDHEGKPYGPSKNWDDYYFGVLAAIAAGRPDQLPRS